MTIVYVQNKDGKPLMPTTRCGHVRRLLKGKSARVVCANPFTIRLLYDCPDGVQPLYVGIDPGRTNVGLAVVGAEGTPVLAAQVVTRNKDIPKLMEKRKAFRQQHRKNGRRDVRRRRACKAGTVKAPVFERKLPQCDKPIVLHDIRNKEARFCNRKRPAGWLTPTARQLLLTHINAVRKIAMILPISDVVLELNRFDFQAMDNPNIQKWQYGCGPLFGKGSVENAVYDMQEGKCLLCGGRIQHYHHVVPKHLGGSNTYQNIAGLCEQCHKDVHTSAKAKNALAEKKQGLNMQYHALSVLNQIIPFLVDELTAMFPGHAYVTNGLSTSECRKTGGYVKDHHVDAYCIALAAFPDAVPAVNIPEPLEIQQFRRHDRQACIRQMMNRVYCLDGKPIAYNRHKAFEQKEPSLEDVLPTLTDAQISRLTVKPHPKQYKDPSRIMPGAVFMCDGKRHMLQANAGNYFIDTSKEKHPHKKCIFVKRNTGLVVL